MDLTYLTPRKVCRNKEEFAAKAEQTVGPLCMLSRNHHGVIMMLASLLIRWTHASRDVHFLGIRSRKWNDVDFHSGKDSGWKLVMQIPALTPKFWLLEPYSCSTSCPTLHEYCMCVVNNVFVEHIIQGIESLNCTCLMFDMFQYFFKQTHVFIICVVYNLCLLIFFFTQTVSILPFWCFCSFPGQLNKPPFGKFESILGFKDCGGADRWTVAFSPTGRFFLQKSWRYKGTKKKDVHGDTMTLWIWQNGIYYYTVRFF